MKKSQLLAAPSLFSMARRCVLTVVLLVTGYSAALAASRNIMISTDMMQPHLYLTNIDTDKRIKIDLSRDHQWSGGLPLHTIITPDGRKAYLSVMNTDDKPLTILALQIGNIDWRNGTADVRITKVMLAGDPGIKPSMLVPTETDPNQPVTALWTTSVNNHQLHGPTAHPSWKFVYFTDWTDNKIRVVDVDKDELAAVDPIRDGTLTRQLHGVFFNPNGTLALAPGYYYDMNQVILFKVNEQDGNLTVDKVIPLTVSEENKEYAAFTHFVTWLDNRRAITSSQQTGNTSLTPTGWKVIGPSVWLIDAVEGKGKMIIGPARRRARTTDPASTNRPRTLLWSGISSTSVKRTAWTARSTTRVTFRSGTSPISHILHSRSGSGRANGGCPRISSWRTRCTPLLMAIKCMSKTGVRRQSGR